jgi:RNA polymerase sigma-70 factor (ECF subfamily)
MDALSDDMLACRPVLRAHCYRMLGHPQDADDAVQETFLRAVRGVGGYEGRAAPQSWLLRIATRVCLDALAVRKRRRLPMEGSPGNHTGPFVPTPPEEWIAPFPDAWLEAASQPEQRVALWQRVDLALITVLKKLPPRQRAALLLAEVFDWSAAEVAEALEVSVASVNSALQRAREKLGRGVPGRLEVDPAVVSRYRSAFARYDIDALLELLTDDATFDMPPIPTWLQGREEIGLFLRGPGSECLGSLIHPVHACGTLGFAQYRHGGRTPWALVVLETRDGKVSAVHNFLDTAALFPLFGLPAQLDEESSMSGDGFGGLTPLSAPSRARRRRS